MKNLFILGMLFLSSSCSSYSDQGKWLDFYGEGNNLVQVNFPKKVAVCNFSPEEEKSVRENVLFWNQVTGENLFQILKDCVHPTQTDVYLDRYIGHDPYDFAGAGGIFMSASNGHLNSQVYILIFNPFCEVHYPTQKLATIHHELGHYLGLGHDYPLGCLMRPSENTTGELCTEEWQELCQHYPWFQNCKGI